MTRKRAWTIALAATFTMTVSQLDRTTLAVLAPTVCKVLGISEIAYGWLSSAFAIAYLVSVPVAGLGLERTGARRGLMISLLVWSVIAGMHGLAVGYVSLFALRIALGMAEAPSYPGAATTIQHVLPERERARGFGVLFTGSSIGMMLAAPLAAWLYGKAGWRVAFLGTSVIGLSWVPLWLLLTQRRDVATRLDVHASASSTTPWHEIIRQPKLMRAMIAVVAAAPLQALPLVWGAKYLVRTFHVEQKDVGHWLWIPLLAFDLATVVFGDLASRRKRLDNSPRVLFAVGALLASGLALLGHAHTPMQGMLIMAIALAGSGAMYTLLVADLLVHVPNDRVARTVSYLPAAQSIAGIIASPLVGMMVTSSASYTSSAIALGLWTIPGALIWLLWNP